MIAVQTDEAMRSVVAEFFELFKTPWEFFYDGSEAEVVICSRLEIPVAKARLVLIYSGETQSFDVEERIGSGSQTAQTMLSYRGKKIPVYGSSRAFGGSTDAVLRQESTGVAAMTKIEANGQTIVRMGYDLFQEVRHLLTHGQPEANADIPTLDLHIVILRDLILASSIPLVEIPPVPAGCKFIACLTHDVDHVGIKNHKFDHTMFGFLHRATLGSLLEVFRGRKTWPQLAVNWLAALKLPLVHLGLAGDFWYQFNHYVEIEDGAASTFFVIPKKGETGLDAQDSRPVKRKASYDAADLKAHLQELQSAGKEIGVHGLDSWRDVAAGRDEHDIISRLTGAAECGVRMHWLYFDEHSHAELERAGFTYDSTVGYNGTVGYRAGTVQVFKPLTTAKLLELPMHIMDTALFYPSHLDLSPPQAEEKMRPLIANAVHFGGVLTVNWHDRSIAPERLWDGTYRRLLEQFKTSGARFATAAQTVAWFKKRREAAFEPAADGRIKIKAAGSHDGLPALLVRFFQPGASGGGLVEKSLPEGGEICPAV